MVISGTVASAERLDGLTDEDPADGARFRAVLADGRSVRARRLLVASGLVDDARGIPVVEGEVAALDVVDDQLAGVRLRSGEVIPRRAVVVAPASPPAPRCSPAWALTRPSISSASHRCRRRGPERGRGHQR